MMIRSLVLVSMLMTLPALADETSDPRAGVARIVALAEVAPQVCTDLATDPAAVTAFLRHAGMSAEDVTTRYADPARSAVDDFEQASARDEEAACSDAWDRLGESGLGLLVSKGDD